MEFCWSFLFGFWVDRWSSAGVSCLVFGWIDGVLLEFLVWFLGG